MSQPFGQSRTVRYEDKYTDGLCIRDVYGLNMFRANDVQPGWRNDPMQIALEGIAAMRLTAGHVGALALEDVPDEGNPPSVPVSPEGATVPIGLHGGTFYRYGDQPLGYLFRSAPKLFATWSDRNLEYLVRRDSLALYVLGDTQSFDALCGIGAVTPVDHTAWVHIALERYSLLVLTEADGWTLRAFGKTSQALTLLSPSIERACDSIERSKWYIENSDRLHWDAELDLCLKIPAASEGCEARSEASPFHLDRAVEL